MNQKRVCHLRVPVTLNEKQQIIEKAQTAGLSMARYMRMVSLGYRVSSVMDNQKIEQLLKINGDMGRVGGLLKMWLSNDVKLKIVSRSEIEDTLYAIRSTQSAMLTAIFALKKR